MLDVGCSYGHVLYKLGEGSLGVDIKDKHVEFARAMGLNVVKMDIEESIDKIEDGSFDAILCSDILEHCTSLHNVVLRLRMKLKQNGYLIVFIVTYPNNRFFRWLWKRLFGYEAYDSYTHYYQFTAETARYLVQRGGVKIIETHIPYPSNRLLNKLLNLFLYSNFIGTVIIGQRDDAEYERVLRGKQKNLGENLFRKRFPERPFEDLE